MFSTSQNSFVRLRQSCNILIGFHRKENWSQMKFRLKTYIQCFQFNSMAEQSSTTNPQTNKLPLAWTYISASFKENVALLLS